MIHSPFLKHCVAYIGSRWSRAESGETMEVVNPLNGSHLADVPMMGVSETIRAIEKADASMREIPSLSHRRAWLSTVAEKLLDNKEELGRILTLEHGKPFTEAVAEVEYSAGFFSFCAERIHDLESQRLDGAIRGCDWTIHHRPAGVAALIVPWNFPLAMLAKKLAGAVAAGCATVCKPASLTPLSTIACFHILADLNLPSGFVNLVIGGSGPIGNVLCSHPLVRAISFTGSTKVGSLLIEKTAPHIKRLALELGGNAPFIVFEDADLELAAEQLMLNKFRSAGQTCVCANRVYVHDAVADEFAKMVTERTHALKMGDGMDKDTHIGPLVNRAAFDKVAEHVKDALAKGAKRLVGHDPPRPVQDYGAFYPPTVLTNVTPKMIVCKEETFGPLVAMLRFHKEEDVVKQANNTPFGLAAYLFTTNVERQQRVTPQLMYGHIGVNTGTGPTPQAPFGGMKKSGFGREGGLEGIFEFCETQVVATNAV